MTTTAPTQVLDEKLSAHSLPKSPSPSELPSEAETVMASEPSKLAPELSTRTKYGVLSILILSYFIDVLSSSAFFVFTHNIANSLNVIFEQQSWIITSYTVTFASFLLFWGRVSDLYSAPSVFQYGFLAFGSISLVLSFLTNAYAFYILRAMAGIAGSALVPSAYRLIAATFPEGPERSRAYTLYGMTGSIANSTGTVVAGIIGLIHQNGQMENWRWFFRICAFLSIPTAIASFWLIPKHEHETNSGRWKRLDPVGVLSMLTAILLLIVALTLGATYGWKSAGFIAPLVVSVIAFPFFFWWETRLPETHALLPPSLWKVPNFPVFLAFALIILGWWASNFMPFLEMFQIHGDSMIVAAVRTLPEGASAMVISLIMIIVPNIITNPRWPIFVAMIFVAGASLLWTFAPSVVGVHYWAYVFPGMVMGSTGMQIVLISTIVGVMAACPGDKAGVVGAALQTAMHTSTVVALSIQAGLLTTKPGGLENYTNFKVTMYFEFGWVIVWLAGFMCFYRRVIPSSKDVEAS